MLPPIPATLSPVLTNGSSNKRGSIPYVVKTFLLNELSNRLGEALVMSLHIIFQDQTTQRTSWLICLERFRRKEINSLRPNILYTGRYKNQQPHSNNGDLSRDAGGNEDL